jgi:hypothetical protein
MPDPAELKMSDGLLNMRTFERKEEIMLTHGNI